MKAPSRRKQRCLSDGDDEIRLGSGEGKEVGSRHILLSFPRRMRDYGLARAVVAASAALCLAASALECEGPVHNSYFGARGPYDELDFMDHIQESSKFLRITEKVVSYPLDFQKPNMNTVTYIEVLDVLKNGNNGCAYLVNGGPGYNYTDIKFKSKRNQGIDMVIRIYVKKYF